MVLALALALSPAPLFADGSGGRDAGAAAQVRPDKMTTSLMQAVQAFKRRDFDTALRLATPLALNGDPTAETLLGDMFVNGQGVPQDFAEALRWYRKAADQGHAEGEFRVGAIYSDGLTVQQDQVEAVRWFRMAAVQGHPQAQLALGVKYELGQGVQQDYVAAHMWFALAAAQGNQLAVWTRDDIAAQMTPAQIAQAQKMAHDWKPAK